MCSFGMYWRLREDKKEEFDEKELPLEEVVVKLEKLKVI